MNAILNRLKNNIDKQILNKVQPAQLEQLKFVPISVKDKFLFVAIGTSITDKDVLTLKLKEMFPYQIKFIQVSDSDLEQLILSVTPMMGATATTVSSPEGQAKLGELMVQKGHITDLQLLQALAESKRLKMPIGSTLFKLGFINLQQLKEILQEQTGYEVVNNEHLSKQDKFINLLPEDFIKANKAVPQSSDGKTLI